VHVLAWASAHTHTHTRIHTYTHTHTNTHVHTRSYACTHIHNTHTKTHTHPRSLILFSLFNVLTKHLGLIGRNQSSIPSCLHFLCFLQLNPVVSSTSNPAACPLSPFPPPFLPVQTSRAAPEQAIRGQPGERDCKQPTRLGGRQRQEKDQSEFSCVSSTLRCS